MTDGHSSVRAAALIARLDDLDVPDDRWWRANAIAAAVLDGEANNSVAFCLRRFGEGVCRDDARRHLAYALRRDYRIRSHSTLASLPVHVGEQAVAVLADVMLDMMEDTIG